ncbi:hypothetical protein PGT21_027062 [Puccinia graminis f. sp. tritici]|uniref:Uncharacterized protein n=2 Tax=Puccinia graminis f. sp. tritici TaxID=56615 RepID=A0A5B0MVQ4_PUCGR|nr:hypothetical protein PGT21_027062 [Puccinia graminis f. sp. tritici]
MHQGSYTNSINQLKHNYEERIQYLEEVVGLLIARREPPSLPPTSSAPLCGSFRYSIRRGLEPVLSMTATSLPPHWRIGRPVRQKHARSPPRRQAFGFTCQPLNPETCPSITQSSSSDSAKSLSPTSLPKSFPKSRTPSAPSFVPDASIGGHSPKPASQTDQSPHGHPSNIVPPDQTDVWPLSTAAKDHASITITTVHQPSNAIVVESRNPLLISSPATSPTSDTKLQAAVNPMEVSASPTDSGVPLGTAKTAAVLVHSAETLASPTVTQSPSSVIAIVTESPASTSINAVSVSEIIVTTEDPTLTSSLLDPLTQAATLDTLGSKNHIFEASHQAATQINHPIGIVPPTALSSINSILDSTTSTATSTSSNYLDCSSPVYPTAEVCPENTEVAEAGSLAIENDESASMDSKIAPEYSHTTLEYYNDIDNYLKLSGVNETQIRRKKKKKKKTTNHNSDSCISAPPVDIPIAAVGSLTVMSEEELAALERQNDPRYRPIEDSEFVPFEDWRGDSEILLSGLVKDRNAILTAP